jgi:uncharacterized protein YbaP (TraB family)
LKILDQFLLVLGFAKLSLLVVFFASFGLVEADPVFADTQDKCAGVNLLKQLEEDDPAAYAGVIKEADTLENAKSIFWKISKAGVKDSYLLGTMHMADPDISVLPEDASTALDGSETVIVEATDALDPKKAQEAMAKLSHLTLLQEGSLSDLVEDDLEDELKAAVEARGIPYALADRMQPWLIATTISLPICELQRKQDGSLVLDAVLAKRALDAEKPLIGLETAQEQLEAIAGLPVEFHVESLEETLASGDIANDMIFTLKELYKSGQIGYVFPLMKAVLPKSGNSSGAAQFQEALIEKRNVTMAERLASHLEKGNAFVAVGALHLPGETGLVTLLRGQGYTVETLR